MTSNLKADAVSLAWKDAEDSEQARAALREIMRRDDAIYRAVMEPHEGRAIADAIGAYRTGNRAALWVRPSAPDARVRRLAQSNVTTFYDFPLPSGVRIGNATREDLAEAAATWRGLARANDAKADFVERVMRRIQPGQVVRDVLSAADLEGIKGDSRDAA